MRAVEPWRASIAAAVTSANTPEQAAALINEWSESQLPEDQDFSDVIYRSAILSWMSGNLFVSEVEMPAKGVSLAGGIGTDLALGGDSFLSAPFMDAVRLFLARSIVDPEEFYARLDQTVARSFTATLLAKGRVRDLAFASLEKALSEGMSLRQFADAIHAEEISLGITPSKHGYLRTVFDTNVATAYSAGRDEQLTNPAVIEAVPMRVYVAVIDDRTRSDHIDMHGKMWDARETDEWREYQGPNGFNCRCQVISSEDETLAADLAAEIGASHTREVTHPDENFQNLPRLDV